MRSWWRAASVAAVGVAASTTLVLSAAPSVQASTGSGSAVGLLAYGNTNLYGTDPGHFDVVVINPDQYGELGKIRAANPNVKVLVYKNIAMTETYDVVNGVDNPFLPSGVGWAWANANQPGWFLKDTNGNRVQWADYPSRWWMDMGNTNYQNAWATNVINEVHNYGLDGVMLDDVDMHTGGHLPSGTTLAKYPTDADYAAANESFLANVGPQLHNAGVLAVPNIAFRWSSGWETAYKRWLAMCDGVLMEWWTKPGLTSSYARFGENDWDYQMQQAADVRAAGKMFIPLTYGALNDSVTQMYARASFLLAWDGKSSVNMYIPEVKGQDPWQPSVSAYVGKPTGERRQLTNGVWRRDFTGGTVLVNPSRTATRTVDLGVPMGTVSGATVSSVSLAPMTGAVLSTTTAPSPSASPSGSPSPSPSVSPTTSPSPTATATATSSPTATATASPTPSPSATTASKGHKKRASSNVFGWSALASSAGWMRHFKAAFRWYHKHHARRWRHHHRAHATRVALRHSVRPV